MTDHTPDRCYAKGRKKGWIVQTHLDLEPRRTHGTVRRAITYTSTHRLGYVLFVFLFILLRMQAIGRECHKPDQAHMYSVYCCTVYNALPVSLILSQPILLAAGSFKFHESDYGREI